MDIGPWLRAGEFWSHSPNFGLIFKCSFPTGRMPGVVRRSWNMYEAPRVLAQGFQNLNLRKHLRFRGYLDYVWDTSAYPCAGFVTSLRSFRCARWWEKLVIYFFGWNEGDDSENRTKKIRHHTNFFGMGHTRDPSQYYPRMPFGSHVTESTAKG